MQNRIFYFIVISGITIFSFVSCQKDYSPTIVPTTDSTIKPTNDSTLLKMYVKLDTSHTPGRDTLVKMEFEYDNLKRVNQFRYSEYDSATGEFDYEFNFQFFYNGTDTLPFKSINEYGYNFNAPGASTINYTYNQNGDVTYYKEVFLRGDSIVTNKYFSGNTFKAITNYYPYNNNFHSDTTFQVATIFSDDNIVHDVHEFHDQYFAQSFYREGVFTYDLLFDTYINPFKKLNFFFKADRFFFWEGFEDYRRGYLLTSAQNNITHYTFNRSNVDGSNPDNDFFDANYAYNVNNLPVSSHYTISQYGEHRTYYGKELYFYTR